MKPNFLLIIVILLIAFASCTSNNQYTETREIEGVKRLKINGVFNLKISQYDQESLSIEGSQELAEKLEVNQTGDLLELSLKEYKGGIFQKKELLITLTIADLKELEFEGAGYIRTTEILVVDDLRIRGNGVGNISLELEAQNVDAELNFVGSMTLKGEVGQFDLKNEGIGNIDASKFRAGKLNLISSGIGNISVYCEDELSLQVDGIGNVSYKGNPVVIKEKVSGIGKVNRN